MTETERIQDRNKLAQLIQQWNQDHYDLFELSAPNEAGEFHGVVRFYFQDQDKNVVTKCIRVASSATTRDVVEILMEKFRPDMRMLTESKYSLYEVHVNGEERKLFDDERPLYVQLSWGKDVREGRFLLKRDGQHMEAEPQNFKRKLSKREKKEKRKQEKERKLNKENKENVQSVAEKLYNEVPDTSFTRSISNPEAVMRRRRQQKIEKKWAQFSKQNGQGGTLKIYGETLRPDVPYKTLLLSSTDTVKHVIKEAMEKYDMNDAEPDDFCLVQVLVPPGEREYHGGPIGEETVLKDEDCPLAIAMKHPPSRGVLIFQLKRRNADMIKPKYKRQRAVSHDDLRYTQDQPSTPPNKLPFLVEFNPDGTENPKGKVHRLHLDVTEVGSEKTMSMSTSGQYLQLHGPNIQPRHCVIAHTGGIVTVTPTSRESEVYVNNQRIFETTLLQHGMVVKFGKMNAFRFIDPAFEEKQKKVDHMDNSVPYQYSSPGRAPETNFQMNGHVETVTGGPHPQRQDSRPSVQDGSQKSSPRDTVRGDVGRGDVPKNYEELLPAALEFRDDKENEFLRAIILEANPSATQFKLSPTYTLYMAVRFCLSNMYQPDISPTDRAHKLTSLVNKIADMANQTIQDNRDNPASLAFWMANASEILHFLKQDHDIHPFSQESQEVLAEGVQMAFHHLVRCLQYDLQRTMPAFLDESDSVDEEDESRVRYNRNKPALSDVLDTLSSAMNLLRRCRVNAALTIQLFSQLFHFVNMWLFNTLIIEKRLQLCTRAWGIRLKRRLGRIEAWAEKQGLELAADCHLCRIIQAAHLLEAPKSNPDDIASISSTCFKLNSLQLKELLQSYIPELGEPPIPMNLVDRIVSVAQNMADDLIRAEGREVQLQEDPDLQLPFLLPEDGYSCDTIRGIPNGLGEFIEPAARAGLCRMTPQPQAPGVWTVYMAEDEGSIINETLRKERPTPEPRPQPSLPKEPEIVTVAFNKVKGSMGLSIVAAKGDGQRERGIYIKSVVPGGAAAIDGRLQAGDQLLEVDGKSLVGLTQEKSSPAAKCTDPDLPLHNAPADLGICSLAAELMTKTGQTVTLKVAKQGAIYHGLATLLSQPSPVMPRAANQKAGSPGIQPPTPNKQRPNEEGPPPYTGGNVENDRLRSNMPIQKQDVRSLPRDHPGLDKSKQSLRGPDSRSSPALNNFKTRIDWSSKDTGFLDDTVHRLIVEAELRNWRSQLEKSECKVRFRPYKRHRAKSVSQLNNLEYDLTRKELHWLIRDTELRDYRVMAGKLTPMGEHFGWTRNRSLSSGYFSDSNKDVSLIDLIKEDDRMKGKRSDSVDRVDGLTKGSRALIDEENIVSSKNSNSSKDKQRNLPYSGQNFAFSPNQSTGYGSSENKGTHSDRTVKHIRHSASGSLYRSGSLKKQQRKPVSITTSGTTYTPKQNTSPDWVKHKSYFSQSTPQYKQRYKPLSVSETKTEQYMHSVSLTGSQSKPFLQSNERISKDNVVQHVFSGTVSEMSNRKGRPTTLPIPPTSLPLNKLHSQSYSNGHNPKQGRQSTWSTPDGDDDVFVSEDEQISPRVLNRPVKPKVKTLYELVHEEDQKKARKAQGVLDFKENSEILRRIKSTSSLTSASPHMAQGFRAPPNGNLREPSGMQNQPISSRPQQGNRRENHELDKAKSIPNLRMDISYDGPIEGYQQMRPAMSVGALQQQGNPNHDYYNQVPQTVDKRDMIDKSHDYENHPSVDPRLRQPEPLRDNRSQSNPGQSMPPQLTPSIQVAKPVQQQLQPSDRVPQTSRHSGNFRDERPQSAYFGQQDRPESLGSRPKSAEINSDWQDRFGQGGFHGQQAPGLDRSFENRNGPNYSNIRPQPNYANQGEIQKLDINNQERQLNFYENTVPRQQSSTPPFHQLRRPPSEEKPRPYLAPKPKPNQPVIQPAEIPRTEVDHRQTQPHFYDVRIAQERQVQAPASQGFLVAPHQQAPPQQAPPQQSHYQNTGFQDPRMAVRGKFSPGHDKYNQFQGPGIPPPPSDVPPELPPPPKMEDLRDEELPPLPPPPVMDYRLEQQIRNEQNRMMQQMDPDYSMHQPDHSYSNLPPQGYDPYNKFPNQISPNSIPNSHADYADRNTYPPNYHDSLRQPSIQPAQTQIPLNPSHDYQNIEYPRSANRSFETQKQLSTAPNQQNLYETYDPRVQPQQPQPQKPIDRPSIHKAIKEQREVVVSPWDRDAKEKAQKDQEDTIARMRQSEISDLESKPYLTPQEQERLRKLKIELEFQKRVQEVSAKDDEDEDSDDDRFVSRDRSLQSLQEDLVKARLRMNELEEKHLYQELEREKERTNRLERRIEMFEKEREEQKARLQKRQERQQKENEEYLRKQREAREKQRLQYEENKRLLMQEEEKMNQRKMEEMQKRKEMEKKRLEEIQAQKEAEEAKAREEIRRQEEEYARQQLERQERERREQQREIRVNEERKRLEAMAAQNQNSQYNYQYANLPPQPAPVSMHDSRYMTNTLALNSYAPPPPERGSSFSVANQRSISTSNIRPEAQTDSKFRSFNSATSGRGSIENIPTKKSVSFNTEVQTRESEPRSPTYPPYSSSQPVGVGLNRNFDQPGNNSLANHNSIPQSPIKNNMNDVQYKTAENTPSVIGAQEVYRDPRTRIEAKMANQGRNTGPDRMSFRDKMKYFAAEAGETTPQGRTRASKAQRAIESQLQNGQ